MINALEAPSVFSPIYTIELMHIVRDVKPIATWPPFVAHSVPIHNQNQEHCTHRNAYKKKIEFNNFSVFI